MEYDGWIEKNVGERGKVVKGEKKVIYKGKSMVRSMDDVDI